MGKWTLSPEQSPPKNTQEHTNTWRAAKGWGWPIMHCMSPCTYSGQYESNGKCSTSWKGREGTFPHWPPCMTLSILLKGVHILCRVPTSTHHSSPQRLRGDLLNFKEGIYLNLLFSCKNKEVWTKLWTKGTGKGDWEIAVISLSHGNKALESGN